MQIKYSPQRSDDKWDFQFDEEIIFIKHAYGVSKLDFSTFTDGEMTSRIEYISFAERVNGELILTLCQPVDKEGKVIEQEDFEIVDYSEIEVNWKTQEEIDAEENAPKYKTETELLKEQIATMQGAIDFIIMNY